jgi:hypothetical protein
MGALSPSTIISSGIVRTLPIVGSIKPSYGPSGSLIYTTNPSTIEHAKGNIIDLLFKNAKETLSNCIFMKHLLNSSSKPYIHLKIQEIG